MYAFVGDWWRGIVAYTNQHLYIMKTKNFLLLVLCTLLSVHIKAADGDTFTANTIEGVAMTFKIISETDKTVQVDKGNTGGIAIDWETSGPLTIPSEVTHSNVQYSVVAIGDNSLCCEYLTSIEIPNSVTSIGNYAFWSCTNLETVTLYNGLEIIGREAFEYCDNLTNINLPEGLQTIQSGAFAYGKKLKNVIIPSSVTSVGGGINGYAGAFQGSIGLESVTSNMKTPCTLNSSVFYNLPTCTLYIPYGTKDAYIAKGWTETIFKGGIVEAVDTRVTQSLELTSLPAKTYGDEAYTLPENTVEGLALTWESDNTNVATISGNTLTVTGAGTATITASQVGNDNYKPFSKEFTLTVAKAPLMVTANDATKNAGDGFHSILCWLCEW